MRIRNVFAPVALSRGCVLALGCALALGSALPVLAQDAPAGATAPAPAAGGIDLSLRVKAGDTFLYTQKVEFDQTTPMFSMKNESTSDIKVTVESVAEDGKITLVIENSRVVGWMSSPMFGKLNFDSGKPGGGNPNPMLDVAVRANTAMVGRKLKAVVDARGKVHSVTGFETVVDDLLGDDPSMGMMRPMIAPQFSDGAMRANVEGILPRPPETAVNVGDTWKQEDKRNDTPGLIMTISSEHKLVAADDVERRIESTGSVAAEVDEAAGMAAMQMQGVEVLDSTITGTSRYDSRTGALIATEGKQSMTMSSPQGQIVTKTSTSLAPRTLTESAAPATATPPAKPDADDGEDEGDDDMGDDDGDMGDDE